MYNMIIVDDIPIVRKEIISIIEWEKRGIRIIAEAYNGMEALKIIQENDIDIVLTDIKMPVMDGLEMMKKVKCEKPETRFIVMSVYNEFNLVKQAYNLGVKDYILKTEMTEVELTNVISKVISDIEKCKTEKKQQEKIVDLISNNQLSMKKNHLRELIYTDNDSHAIKNDVVQKHEMDWEYNIIMVIMIENRKPDKPDFFNNKRELIARNVVDILDRIIKEEKFKCDLIYNDSGEYTLLFSLTDIISEYTLIQSIIQLFHIIRTSLNAIYCCSVTGGISSVRYGKVTLRDLYRQASNAMNNSFFMGKDRLYVYGNILKDSLEEDMKILSKKYKNLKLLLNGNENVIDLHLRIEDILLELKEVENLKIESIKEHFDDCYLLIGNYCSRHSILDILKCSFKKYDHYYRNYGDLNQLNQWVASIIKSVMELHLSKNNITRKAKVAIEEHIYDDITLMSLADHLNINPNYLSKLFKKHEGCSFSEYLNKRRVNLCIEYMQNNTDVKLYEISNKFGYSNPQNFSRMFKKMVGKSPKNYL